jgi:DNA-binding NarL/FixJ family response regulator
MQPPGQSPLIVHADWRRPVPAPAHLCSVTREIVECVRLLTRRSKLTIKMERLSRRERQIVEALLAGCANKEIAQRLGVSNQTIKNQLTRLYRKVGVNGRLELVLWAADCRNDQSRRDW